MKVIVISGAYRAPTEYGILGNINHAERAMVRLVKEGWCVICPHKNTAFLGGVVEDRVFLDMCLELIKRADAVYMLDNWKDSLGASEEHRLAFHLKKLILYEEAGDEFWLRP